MSGQDKLQEDFIRKAKDKHGNGFDYSSVVYKNSKTKILILCKKHGYFEATPDAHLRNKACKLCKGELLGNLKRPKWETVKEKIIKSHGNTYIVPDQEYKNNHTQLKIICREHGEFFINPVKLINEKQGCTECGRKRTTEASVKSLEDFKAGLSKDKIKRFDYLWDTFKSFTVSMKIRCRKHNVIFSQTPSRHLHYKGKGTCPECKSEGIVKINRLSFEDFSEKVEELYEGSLELVKESYGGSKELMVIRCNKVTESTGAHGEFKKRPNDLLMGHGCPKCSRNCGVSKGEDEVLNFLRENLDVDCHKGNKPLLDSLFGKGCIPKYLSLDILIPAKKIVVEFNGTYWHSEKFRGKDSHINKTKAVDALGYQLIQIWEDDWYFKREIVKNRLLAQMTQVESRYARKLKIKQPGYQEAKKFLNTIHLQGSGVMSNLNYGLYEGDDLIALATFCKSRFDTKFDWELLRFCSKGRVVGGLSKLLSAFKKEHKGDTLVTYADRSWGNGGAYSKVGFEFEGFTPVDYWWAKGYKRFSRFDFMKHKLVDKLKKFNPALSESQNCRNNGYRKLFGCGNSKWSMIC